MSEHGTAAGLIPEDADLAELRAVAADCTACDLHRCGTQTVFGAGAPSAEIMFVGEQPGDQEDQVGAPFVGPAGRELDRALEQVGIDRDDVYVSNVVKHFKWSERRGKRRIHEKPNRVEIRSCLPWLQAEIAQVRPKVVVALGATAAQAVIDRSFRVTRQRGELHPGPDGALLTATVHPSAILRARTDEDRHRQREAFTGDLRRVARLVRNGIPAALEAGTKDELYRMAQAMEVRGRSSMDKQALLEAVEERL